MFYIWIIDIQFIGKLHFSLKIFMELFVLFTQNCLSLSKKKNFWSSKFTHNTAFLQIFKKRCCWRIHTWPFCHLCVQYKSLIHSSNYMNLAVITTLQYIGNYLYLDDLYIDQTFLPFFKRNLPSNSSCVKYYKCTNILQLQNTTSVTRFWKVGSGLLLQAFTTRSISYSCKHYRYIPNSWNFLHKLGYFHNSLSSSDQA